MGQRVFALKRAILLEAEEPNDESQAQSLSDQRDQDDPKGEEDHEITLREKDPTREHKRQSQCGGKRESPAHANPADNRQLTPLWKRVAGAQASTD
jgi:hypothetical protein